MHDNMRVHTMDQEKYNLCRKSYSVFLQDMMKELMMSSDFADVTLVCEDKKQIKAHRNILSACSPVFKEILQIDRSPSSIIYLRGVNSSQMESILQFIYTGEATLPQEQINEFLSLAKSFDLKDLTEDCEKSGHLGEHEEDTEMANADFTCKESGEILVGNVWKINVDVKDVKKEKIENDTFYDENEPVYKNADFKGEDSSEYWEKAEPKCDEADFMMCDCEFECKCE